MTVVLYDGSASIVRLAFQLDDLPDLLHKHAKFYPNTIVVERLAQELITFDFEQAKAAEFVRSVCRWGGYAGIAGKVLKNNDEAAVAKAMGEAWRLTNNACTRDALVAVLSLHGLAVSFASKHLKFLNPDRHVVLDSIISERLGYRRNPDGYCEFVADCISIRNAVQAAGILRRDGSPFRLADVEMAIFMALRN